jgi:hypothetical protein
MESNIIVGTNVEYRVEGNKMIITVDLTENNGVSNSGKTNVVATTSGSKWVDTPKGKFMVGVNVNSKINK